VKGILDDGGEDHVVCWGIKGDRAVVDIAIVEFMITDTKAEEIVTHRSASS
jgi:hypothetical protein